MFVQNSSFGAAFNLCVLTSFAISETSHFSPLVLCVITDSMLPYKLCNIFLYTIMKHLHDQVSYLVPTLTTFILPSSCLACVFS